MLLRFWTYFTCSLFSYCLCVVMMMGPVIIAPSNKNPVNALLICTHKHTTITVNAIYDLSCSPSLHKCVRLLFRAIYIRLSARPSIRWSAYSLLRLSVVNQSTALRFAQNWHLARAMPLGYYYHCHYPASISARLLAANFITTTTTTTTA